MTTADGRGRAVRPPAAAVPAGVAAISFDPYDPALTDTAVWPLYAAARTAGGAVRSVDRDGFWLLTRYADVQDALLRPETFSSASGHRIPTDGSQDAIPIDYDPPLHGEYRRLMREVMAARRVRALSPFLRSVIGGLVDRFRDGGGGDFVREVALPMPLQVLTEVVGFSPGTVAQFRTVTERIWEGIATDPVEANRQIVALMCRELAEHRRDRPDDFVTRLLDARVDGRALDEDEQARILATLAVAGHETTMNAASSLVHLLALHPAAQERLRADPGRAPRYVEEMLRLRSPAQNFARRTTCPVSVGAADIAAGQAVLLSFAAANRDPERYPDPDRFDPDRDTRGHLAFGWGIHLCLGAALARAELVILLETLVRHPPLHLAGEVAWSGLRGGNHLGPVRLPLTFGDSA